MNKYNPKAICIKCGHKEIGTHYEPGCGESCHPAVMKRNCRRCGYKWEERPLSLEQKPGGGSVKK
jgi:ribosomal protein L40E